MEDRIDSVIDVIAIEKEIVNVEKRLADLAKVIEDYPKRSIFYDTGNAKQLVAVNQQLETSLDSLRTKTIALNQAQSQVQNLKNYNDYKAALSSIGEQQKQLKKDVEEGTITADQYRFKLTQLTEVQFKYKQSISDITKEIKSQQALNFKVPNSIGEAQAQNKILVTQRNSIDVNDTQKIAELNALIDRNNKLIDDNSDKLGKQKINIGNYADSFKGALTVVDSELTQINQKLKLGNLGGIEVEDLTKKSQVLANAQAVLSQNFSSSAKAQKAYNAVGVELANVYGKDSDVFKNFAAQVGLGNKEVNASKESFKTAAGEGSKFGNVFTKIYSGFRQLANLIPGLGLSGVILLLLDPLQAAAASFINLFKSIDAGKIRVQALNEVNTKSVDLYYKETSHVEELSSVINDNSLSLKDRKTALEQLIALNPDYLRGLTLENFNTDEGRKILEKYNTALERKSELQAAQTVHEESNKIVSQLKAEKQALIDLAKQGKVSYDDLSETQQKYLKNNSVAGQFAFTTSLLNLTLDKSDIRSILKNIDEAINIASVKSGASLKIYNQKFAESLTAEGDGSVKGIIENLEQQINKLKKIQPTLLTPEAITANVAQIKKLQDEIDKLLGKTKKKRNDDSEKLIEDFRKKDLDALAKYSQDELTILKNHYKEEADDQYKSLEERQAALKNYYDVSNHLIQNGIDAQEAALTIELQAADKRASKIKDSKKRTEALAAIEQYGVDKIKEIIQNGDTQIAALNDEMYKGNVTIATQSYDKIQKIAEEHYKFIVAQSKIAAQNTLDQIDINKDDDILKLQRQLEAGLITQKDFEAKRLEIEKQALIKQEKINLKRLQDAEIITEALYGVKNFKLINAAKDLEVKINSDGDEKILAKKKEVHEKIKELVSESIDDLGSIGDNLYQGQLDSLNAQSAAIDAKSQKEIAAITASTLAEEEKQRRITAIQKQADFQKQQIEKREREAQREQARFDRAVAIAKIIQNTAIAITNDLKKPFLIPFDAALGAAQLAVVLSQPIPQYKTGTKNAKRGMAIVSEEGREILRDNNGKMFLTPNQPSLIQLAGGEQIIKHSITEDLLKQNNMMHIIAQLSNKQQLQKIPMDYGEKMYGELRSLNGKPPVIIHIATGFESSAEFRKKFKGYK
jgi:hypothetical protein